MSVKESIYHLETMHNEPGLDLSVEEHQAIIIALIVLKTLSTSQEQLIDAIMSRETG